MRIIEGILLFFLVLAGGAFIIFFWNAYVPGEVREYGSYEAPNLPGETLETEGHQFYPNMRYSKESISYRIESSCDIEKRIDVIQAFEVIEDATILTFSENPDTPEIVVLCSDIAPTATNKKHFIAGEGGPTSIINTSRYSVILNGTIALYRPEQCEKPNIAIHEIFHALGFDHIQNKKSIMYPVTDCDQVIDAYLIRTIDELYSVESLPDLGIEQLYVTSAGRYINFNITIANYGLAAMNDSNLELRTGDKLITSFSLDYLDIGRKKILTVQNVRVSRTLESITFVIVDPVQQEELDNDNNVVTISLPKK